MDYSLDCLGHLTKMYMVKTKFVPLRAVVDLDLFKHYYGDQVSASGPSGPLVFFVCVFLEVIFEIRIFHLL